MGATMRLLCPNCGAQYEVDSSMIPDEGRDVQCSNCGKTWFQEPEEIDLGLKPEPRPEPAPETVAAPPSPEPEVAPEETPLAHEAADFKAALAETSSTEEVEPEPKEDELEATEEDDAPEEQPSDPSPPRKELDDNILGILREEADREIEARRSEGIETQPELGPMDAEDPESRRRGIRERMARLRGEEDEPWRLQKVCTYLQYSK